jgi:hypothetical protein
MEDVLEVYTRPHDPARPLVCLDETSKQLDAKYAKADWRFTTAAARIKLKRVYPIYPAVAMAEIARASTKRRRHRDPAFPWASLLGRLGHK